MLKNKKYRVLVAVGTRPEAIKLAPVVFALRRDSRFIPFVCNTAQHRHMVDDVLRLFNIKSDFDLDVMKHNQTIVYVQNTILEKFGDVIRKSSPDMVVVQGDTTTAFTAALAAFYHKVPVSHVEAGLRTLDKWNPFPEEVNRRMIAVVSDIHFASTPGAAQYLLRESVQKNRIHVVGNTVVDALKLMMRHLQGPEGRKARFEAFMPPKGQRVVLVTAHRRENWGAAITELCRALKVLAKSRPDVVIIWPVHPHPQVREPVINDLSNVRNIRLIDPVRYDEFVYLLGKAYLVVTDSGGIQEESASIGKPVLVFRETTERPEVVESGVGELVPCACEPLLKRILALLDNKAEYKRKCRPSRVFGDGKASERIVRGMAVFLEKEAGR